MAPKTPRTAASRHYEALPRDARAAVDALIRSLDAQLGAGFVAFIVYGSAARGDFRPGDSDIDAILVLEDPSRATLTQIASALVLARAEASIEVDIMTADEIARSADVFPLFYDDIQRAHVTLHGVDPFESLEVKPAHRRLRIEQELREIMLSLRRETAMARGNEHALAHAVSRALRQARSPMRALLNLDAIECESHSLDIVMQKAAKRFRVDAANLTRPERKPHAAEDAMFSLLAKAIETVDQLDTP